MATKKKPVYHFCIESDVPMNEAHDTMKLSVLAASAIHGEGAVLIDSTYRLDKETRTFRIDADTIVGRDLARLFAKFMAGEFGSGAFRIERAVAKIPSV